MYVVIREYFVNKEEHGSWPLSVHEDYETAEEYRTKLDKITASNTGKEETVNFIIVKLPYYPSNSEIT